MTISLSYTQDLLVAAEDLAARYKFNLTTEDVIPRLNLTACGLELINSEFKPLIIDFNADNLQRRALSAKNQGLLKACKPKKNQNIIDATAGLGRDAFIMACHGANVVMLERNNILAALLDDALARFVPPTENFGSLELQNVDGLQYLSVLEYPPDLIYMDPMHPTRKKSALVKKDMQLLQQLIGPDLDAEDLLRCAIAVGCERVVMKWPQKHASFLKPSYSIPGTTVRFDVFN